MYRGEGARVHVHVDCLRAHRHVQGTTGSVPCKLDANEAGSSGFHPPLSAVARSIFGFLNGSSRRQGRVVATPVEGTTPHSLLVLSTNLCMRRATPGEKKRHTFLVLCSNVVG